MAILSNKLPVGVRFLPTDHELLDYFLRTRIAMGDHFHSDFVADCPHFYVDNEPWVVWQIHGGGESKKVEDEKTIYFFTHRRRLSPTAKRFDRKVGSGTWSRHLERLRKNPRKAPPTPTAQGSNVVENTRVVNDKKRKSIVDQPRKPKSKKQKKEGSCHQEEGSSTLHPNYELPYPQMDDLDFYFPEIYPELFVDDERDLFTMDELLGQSWEEGNNFNLVTGVPLL
ncbi:NAC domain-containing protein 37 [Rosa chinensis]|uniref:NAC domain-containing protein 37 n=1 Tax=Rosa chinensis TaxID=74649 RepID=UPI000D08EAE3|nr:NAC domain-containing protein 37 [Rosa chinensis]